MRVPSLLLAALLLLGSAPVSAGAQRIVTLAPHLAELVCNAGACERLVGVVRFTDYPEQAARRPLVGDAANLNYEQIVALRPDLVLSWDGGTPAGTVQRLRQLGLRVEPVRVRNLRDIGQALTTIGMLVDNRIAAGFAVKLFYRRLDQLRNAHWQKRRVRVMYQIETDPIYTISDLSPIDEGIKLCGGDNVFAPLAQIAPAVSKEAVLAANPDVVLFARQDDTARIRELWSRWPGARAQQLGTLYEVDGNLLTRQAPRMLEGIEQLCAALDLARNQLARKS
jgi:iron complex transport system substrate-binding protein